jgi:uncharacterized HAD superfamily protein
MPSAPMPLFGCDIDGCVYPFIFAARSLFNLRGLDVEVSIDADVHWDTLQAQVPPEEWEWLWGAGRKTVFDSSAPYPGSTSALRQIQGMCRVKYVTHRPLDVAHVTMNWMAKHKLTPYALMHTPGEPKSQHAKDCIAFVEDRPDNAMEIAIACPHVQVFVPRRPWNLVLETEPEYGQQPVPGNITLFDDWKEVVAWVRARTLQRTS